MSTIILEQLYQSSACLMAIKECHVAFQTLGGRAFKLLQPIECKTIHSHSAILAIASHLMKRFPEIDPPGSLELLQSLKLKITPAFNPLFQLWYDFLIKCIQEDRAQRHGDAFYICIPLKHLQNLDLINRPDIFQQADCVSLQNTPNSLKSFKIFSLPYVQRTKRIGFYIISSIVNVIPVVSRLTPALLIGHLFNNQRWEAFDILKGNIPTPEHLQEFNAVFIPDSTESVLSQIPEIQSALKNLISAYESSKTLKLVGICYGHQWLAQHFGSQIVKKELRRDITGVVINKQILKEIPYLQTLKEPQYLLLSQYNEDFVETVPKGFDLLAYSKGCKVQGLLSHDRRILTTQFHSEFLFDYVFDLQEQLRSLGAKEMDCLEIPKEITDGNNRDSVLFLRVISGFIDL